MSLVFTDKLLSNFFWYISNKMITCNDKDAQWLNLQFDAILEFIENGSVKSKTQQIKLFVKLSAHILKSWGENYLILKVDKSLFGPHLK